MRVSMRVAHPINKYLYTYNHIVTDYTAILAHNHPSGLAEPSRTDVALTTSLRQTLALIDVKVLDHFIVAGPVEPLSFAERGLL